MSETGHDGAVPPLLRIVHGGQPTAEEITALVVAMAMAGEPEQQPTRRSAWAERGAGLRRPLPSGVDAWRQSARMPGMRTRAGI